MADRKKVVIIGGGTVAHVRNHLALCAPAYGETARLIETMCRERFMSMDVELHLSRMAGGYRDGTFETVPELKALVEGIVADRSVKVVFMNAAVVDFEGDLMEFAGGGPDGSQYTLCEGDAGEHSGRLSSRGRNHQYAVALRPTEKVLSLFRMSRGRKDVFLVAFKTTCGATEDEQYAAGLNLLKASSCNLVLANDVVTRKNMVITPEEARYHVTENRVDAIWNLVEMAWLRSHLTFTRSTVVSGDTVGWQDERVPSSLRTVVDHCVARGAYKAFRGATVGHFACKLDDQTFLTSIRKSNFNDIERDGLVLVKTDGPDTVLAYGAKPSVGGQSQRIVFNDHPGMDCIVHFHCPIREGSPVPVRSQREYECGSHECGKNTSGGLGQFGNLKAVYLDQHGPNVVFNRSVDPKEVIDFIEANFDLEGKTGGYVK